MPPPTKKIDRRAAAADQNDPARRHRRNGVGTGLYVEEPRFNSGTFQVNAKHNTSHTATSTGVLTKILHATKDRHTDRRAWRDHDTLCVVMLNEKCSDNFPPD